MREERRWKMVEDSIALSKRTQEIEADRKRRWEGAVKVITDKPRYNGNCFYWVDKNGRELTY